MNDEFSTKSCDWFGMALSGLCAFHCIVTSMFMLWLPIMARYYLGNPYIHVTLALFIMPVGAIAFFAGFKRHRRKQILSMGIMAVLFVGLTPQLIHFFLLPLNEPLLLGIGSLILIAAHWWNLKAHPI